MSSFTPYIKVVPSTDGVSIYADAIGDSTKPSIVFIHGFGVSGACFDNLFADKNLLAHFYLVRYDLRGHGRSGKPTTAEDYTSLLFANDFAAVIRAFSLVKPVMVGWSYGASIACDICTHLSPLPISGVIALSGSPVHGDLVPKIVTPGLAGIFDKFFSRTDAIGAITVRSQLIDFIFNDPSALSFDMKMNWLGMTALQTADISAFLFSKEQDSTQIFDLGKKGLVPLLVIGGTEDKFCKSDVVAQEMKLHFRDIDVVLLEGGSHTIFYEKQEETVRAFIKFASRVTAAV